MTRILVIYFLSWSLGLLLISQFGFLMIPVNLTGGDRSSFYKALSNWDGEHFLTIAKNGYTEKIQYAFFPTYPILISLLSNLKIDYLWAGLLISFISTFLSVVFLTKLIRLDYSREIAEKTTLFLLIFPTSFFLMLVYSESLFLLFTILTFYLARLKKIKFHYFFAAIFAALSASTRIVGLAVILSLFVEVYLDKTKDKYKWLVLIAPLGFLGYCFFLFVKTGNPFYFLISEQNWDRSLVLPGVGIWRNFSFILTNGVHPESLVALLDLLFTIFGLGFSIRAFRFLRKSYGVYSLVAVLMPIFTPTLGSMQRFLLVIFPIFILIALQKITFQYVYVFISILLLSAYIIFYINGLWVS